MLKLVVAAIVAGAAAGPAGAAPQAQSYDLILHASVSAGATIAFDDADASAGYTSHGALKESWRATVVFRGVIDAKGRLTRAVTKTQLFTAELRNEPAEYANGVVDGSWGGDDYRYGGTDRYPYSCKYHADASTFDKAHVVWNVRPLGSGKIAFNVYSDPASESTAVRCQGGDPGRGFADDYPIAAPGWAVGTLEPDDGLSGDLRLAKGWTGGGFPGHVDLQTNCGGPCGGPELQKAVTGGLIGARIVPHKK